jgi:hypothetical protein
LFVSEEFKRNGANSVTSSNGFTVEVNLSGGVVYRGAGGENYIRSEWLVDPPALGIILYKGDPGNKGFDKADQSRVDALFSDVARALEFLGYKVQVWSSPAG